MRRILHIALAAVLACAGIPAAALRGAGRGVGRAALRAAIVLAAPSQSEFRLGCLGEDGGSDSECARACRPQTDEEVFPQDRAKMVVDHSGPF